jgi:hypothetical protein
MQSATGETGVMKATPIQQTITLLEQEIGDLDQRRSELARVIESLRPLAGEPGQRRGRVSRVVVEVPRRSKAAKKRNERTNEQSARQHGASLA